MATKNVMYENACFHRREQEPGKTADQFVTALHVLADCCDFAAFRTRLILDRVAVGLADAVLSESLQIDSSVTLETALAKAELKDTLQRQQ